MRRIALALSVLLLAASGVAGAGARGPGGLISPNVTYMGTIPLDSPGVGGKMLQVGGQRRFYVTGAKGLTIYDVTNPALPLVLGAFPFPHFQNEDVDVSDDGTKVVIAADTVRNAIFVVDTSDVANPRLLGSIAEANHTATCVDPRCRFIYGSSGKIYDATDPANISNTGRRWREERGGHALNRDSAGIVISDSNPRFVMDVSDPLNPVVLTTGTPARNDGFLQHNNLRPRADQWAPRPQGDRDPALRPGELLIGNSESNGVKTCDSRVGGLSTWSMANFDRGEPMEVLDEFKPQSGDYVSSGDPPVNPALGCSGHWFTERDNYVTAAWYEHGVRFFRIDPRTGVISQAGYFQPVATEAGAAHWIDDEYVYSVDYARGIDILRFNRDAPEPTHAQLEASWLPKAWGPAAETERFFCRLSA